MTDVRFGFTDDQRLFQSAVRDLLDKECTAEQVRNAWTTPPTRELWLALAGMGVTGITVPEAFGGMGLGQRDVVLLLEETGRAAVPAPIVESLVAVHLLNTLGGDDDKASWLSAIATGEAIVGIGLSPARFVLDADSADLLLLQHDDELHAVAPGDISLERQPSVDGARRLFTVAWTPAPDTRLAKGDAAVVQMQAAWYLGALGSAAQLVGLAQHLLDVTVDYAKTREQFGAPIGSFQAVKHHLANAALAVEFARPLVYRAAGSVEGDDADRWQHVGMAKASASDAASMAARIALQVHGAIGYAFEYDLHLWMKRVWALAASWGDAAAHRRTISHRLFG